MGRVVGEGYFRFLEQYPDDTGWLPKSGVSPRRAGQHTERAYFDAEGNPATLMPDGRVHRVMLMYDDSGHVVEEAYFGTGGNPVPGSTGVHKIVRKFNGHGNMTEISFFDTREEPASLLGRHRIASVYGRGEFVSESYFDAGRQPVVRNGISGRRKKPDAIEMLDQDGNPTSTLGVITVSALPIPGDRGGCESPRRRHHPGLRQLEISH